VDGKIVTENYAEKGKAPQEFRFLGRNTPGGGAKELNPRGV